MLVPVEKDGKRFFQFADEDQQKEFEYSIAIDRDEIIEPFISAAMNALAEKQKDRDGDQQSKYSALIERNQIIKPLLASAVEAIAEARARKASAWRLVIKASGIDPDTQYLLYDPATGLLEVAEKKN